MAGIVLGGDKNARGRRVLLPPGAMRELQKDVISTCLVPTGRRDALGHTPVCGEKFYKGQEQLAQRHATRCAERHGEFIRAHIEAVHPSIMKPADVEFARWMRMNKDALMSGRMKA